MDRPYIEDLRIENYGCIQDATFRFTPLHALIGPNDSGKSTVLRALLAISRSRWEAMMSSVAGGLAAIEGEAMIRIVASNTSCDVLLTRRGPSFPRGIGPDIERAIGEARLMRLDSDVLRAAHPLIPDEAPLCFQDERGAGLPALYDGLVVRNLPAYLSLNEALRRSYPGVSSIQLTTPSPSSRGLGVKLADGTFVPAELMSEGMLLYLAFAILPHLEPTSLFLVEAPEKGLHPARIAEVMCILRAVSEKTQVIITTHSPLVVNELRPDEVTVVTRSKERGTRATSMKDTPNFHERSKVYALGELWLSYANGEDEAPLLDGKART